MPWWASLYLACYVAFCGWAVSDDIKSHDNPRWFVAAEIIGDACLLLAGLSFWFAGLHAALHPFLIPVLAAGLAVLIGQTIVIVRRNVLGDPELSFEGKVFVGLSGTLLLVGLSGLLIYWGFNAAVLNRVGV